MKVAIIGTGNIGTALGGSLARAGHEVVLAGQDTEKSRAVAEAIGATAVDSPADAARSAEVVVLAVPGSAAADVARELGSAADDTVVIDVTNPLKPDYSGLANEGGPSNAELIASVLPRARVAKAFNTLFGSLQAAPAALAAPLDAFYATDDDVASGTVAQLASSIGFRPVRVGPLPAARELEAMAWLNIRLQLLTGGDWQSTFVLVGAPQASLTA